MSRLLTSVLVAAGALVISAPTSSADPQEQTLGGEAEAAQGFPEHRALFEITGNWGAQMGTQTYVPNGTPGASKAPLTNGLGFGATAGVAILHDVDVIADYQHGHAVSRSGDVTNALTSVDGAITYDAFAAGLRLGRNLGPGRMYAQLGLGVVLPYSTVVTYEYADTLAPLGIMGTGTSRDNYGLAVGGHGEFGYQFEIASKLYFAAALRLQAFQSSNDGQVTNLNNFVTDFSRPQPVTMDIHHGTSASAAATPENSSVQDARFHLILGYAF